MPRGREDEEVPEIPLDSRTPSADERTESGPQEDRRSHSNQPVRRPSGVRLTPTISLGEMASICQLEELDDDGKPLSPMGYIRWERGVKKVFQMIPSDLDTVKMVILKTLKSERARETMLKAKSYDSIIEDLKAMMWNIGFKERARDLLKTIKQGSNSVSEYDQIFSDLVTIAGMESNTELQVVLFLNGLNPRIRAACLGDTSNIMSLRTKALAVEKIIQQMESVGQQSETVACVEDVGSEDDDESECLHAKSSTRKPKKKDRSRSVRCFKCGGRGHLAKQCPSPSSLSHNNTHMKTKNWKKFYCEVHVYERGRDSKAGPIIRPVQLGGTKVDVLVDTGASASVVEESVVKQLKHYKVTRAEGWIHGIGKQVPIIGKVRCSLYGLGTRSWVSAFIVKSCPHKVIIGRDFLAKHCPPYSRFIQELTKFREEVLSVDTQDVEEKERVELLHKIEEKCPGLLLEKGQVPPKDRVYKGMTFRLGLKREARKERFFRPQYPPKPGEVDFFMKAMEPLIRTNVWEKTSSPHNNPILMVPKKAIEGKPQFRLVVDNRMVNQKCVAQVTPGASQIDTVRQLAGATYFTTCDLSNAFYSLVLDKQDRPFTAITLPGGKGRYQLTRMPMGAVASMAALNTAIQQVLGDVISEYVAVWADDVVIYSKTKEEHVRHVMQVMQKLDEAGFCISRHKLELFHTQVSWLGYDIDENGIRIGAERVQALQNLARPGNPKQLMSVLGLFNYLSSHIVNYAKMAKPLRDLQKAEKWKWTEECEEAFKKIKEVITHAPTIGFLDPHKELYMHTDASQDAIAGILTQVQNGKHVIIDTWSKANPPRKTPWSATMLEAEAVIKCARRWKNYLWVVPITHIISDAFGLQFLKEKAEHSRLVQRWLAVMEDFKYDVVYRKGEYNIADPLSRFVEAFPMQLRGKRLSSEFVHRCLDGYEDDPGSDYEPERDQSQGRHERRQDSEDSAQQKIPNEQVTWTGSSEAIAELQRADTQCSRYLKAIQGHRPRDFTGKEAQDIVGMTIKKGVLIKYENNSVMGRKGRIVLPEKGVSQALRMAHDMPQAGHRGVNGTYQRLRSIYWIRGMKMKVKEYVHTCPVCNARKGARGSVPLEPDERAMELGERVHMDGNKMPRSGPYEHIMVLVDAATKFVMLKPTCGENAKDACELLEEFTYRVRKPMKVTTDRGTAFMSDAFQAKCKEVGAQFAPVGPRQPQANGQVERINKEINEMAAKLWASGKHWSDYIRQIEYALNTSVSEATGYTPYELVYGREPKAIGVVNAQDIDTQPVAINVRNKVQQLQTLAFRNQKQAAQKQRHYHDRMSRERKFEIGDKVRWHDTTRVGKLVSQWIGPFTVVKDIGSANFTLQRPDGSQFNAHKRDMMKVNGERSQPEQADPQLGRGEM